MVCGKWLMVWSLGWLVCVLFVVWVVFCGLRELWVVWCVGCFFCVCVLFGVSVV